MNKVNWTAVAIFTLVAILVVAVGASLFTGWGDGSRGMMGPWMHGGWGFAPFGWIGMLFMWLVPLSFLVLAVLGIISLVRALTGAASWGGSTPATRNCPECSKRVQADWRNCPYCGAELS